jgi:hypothetical protein
MYTFLLDIIPSPRIQLFQQFWTIFIIDKDPSLCGFIILFELLQGNLAMKYLVNITLFIHWLVDNERDVDYMKLMQYFYVISYNVAVQSNWNHETFHQIHSQIKLQLMLLYNTDFVMSWLFWKSFSML